MITSICLLSCALTLAQATERGEWQLTPKLAPGLELVYTGSYLEESLIRNVQHQRQYRLETHVLVLDAGVKDWQVAVMSTLSLQDGRQADKKEGPTSVRLELAKIDFQARMRNGAKKIIDIPLNAPPSLECGFFAPVPVVKVKRDSTWEVSEAGLPAQRWQVVGTESCAGITCLKLVAVQQSGDWGRTRADRAAWRRRDTVWIHPDVNAAQKVERIIERCDPGHDAPTFRTVVRYELDSRLNYPNVLFEKRTKEVLKACKFHEDAQPYLRQPGPHRADIDSLLRRVSFQLEHQPLAQATPYRKAVVHLKGELERAQKGEARVSVLPDDPPVQAARALRVGEPVSEFVISSLTQEKTAQLKSFQGKPILVFFYNPATPLGKEVVGHVQRLTEKHAGLGIMAMAVTADAEVARKQHKDLRLTFPILDGNGMRLTFGADQTPRFVVIDSEGIVRLVQTGWGFQTPYEIDEVLQKCLKK